MARAGSRTMRTVAQKQVCFKRSCNKADERGASARTMRSGVRATGQTKWESEQAVGARADRRVCRACARARVRKRRDQAGPATRVEAEGPDTIASLDRQTNGADHPALECTPIRCRGVDCSCLPAPGVARRLLPRTGTLISALMLAARSTCSRCAKCSWPSMRTGPAAQSSRPFHRTHAPHGSLARSIMVVRRRGGWGTFIIGHTIMPGAPISF